MIDKLKDLQKIASKKGLKLEDPKETFQDDNEGMKLFTISVNTAHGYIKQILLSVDKLLQIKTDIPNAVGVEKENKLSKDIEEHVENVQFHQSKMKVILKQLEESVNEVKQLDKDNCNPETRIKNNLFGSLLKQYEEACTKFQSVESDIRRLIQDKILRAAHVVLGKPLSDVEKENVLNDPSLVQKFYEDKIKVGAHITLQNTVADIEDRHKDLQKLEKSINQVHQLFLELAALVQMQGEIVDNIYNNIATAKDYVQKAEVDIIQSKKNMQSARKKKCCILIIVLVIVIVIVAPILATKLGSA